MTTYGSRERTPEFDGTEFVLFEMKFMAYAAVNGFGEALKPGFENAASGRRHGTGYHESRTASPERG